MGELGEDHLFKGGSLFRYGRSNHRVGVAMQCDPPAADRINQRRSFCSEEQSPFSPHHLLEGRGGCDRCEGWPEVGVMVP
jgi:hypothetical protein